MTSTKKRNGEIDLLRFFFAVFIVLRHGAEFIPAKTPSYFNCAALAVEFFFIVSGYLMAASASAAPKDPAGSIGVSTHRFIGKKFSALMPEFAAAYTVGLVIQLAVKRPSGISKIADLLYGYVLTLFPLGMTGVAQKSQFMTASWYVSAMLIAMLILYPLCLKDFDVFTRIIAPLTGLFILGFFTLNYGTVRGPKEFIQIGETIFLYKGTLRAIGEIALGSAVYPLSRKFASLTLPVYARLSVTLTTAGCFVLTAVWLTFGRDTVLDIPAVILMALMVFAAFSHRGLFADAFDNRAFVFLGSLSMPLYFAHCQIAPVMKQAGAFLQKIDLLPSADKAHDIVLWAVYLGSSFLFTAALFFFSKAIRIAKSKRLAGRENTK